ncbi:MAG: hypothetical protein ABIB41_12460 [Nitrospirota bacterium]
MSAGPPEDVTSGGFFIGGEGSILIKRNSLWNLILNNSTGILVLAFLLCLTACTTDPYIKKLQDDIEQAPYSTEDYIPEVFDCSNMTNFLHDWLGQRGYDTKILVYYINSKDSHAILLVDNKVLIESVRKRIIRNKHPQDYVGALIFKDAETLLEYTPEEKWVKEWGYKQSYLFGRL